MESLTINIGKIENVQRRLTMAFHPQLTYNERLARLHLLTLETRRIMVDLCYKLLNNLIDSDCTNFLVVPTYILTQTSLTRGN